jgi:hypothetical protein
LVSFILDRRALLNTIKRERSYNASNASTAQPVMKGSPTMTARQSNMSRLASVLLWAGRIIAGAWGVIFLLSLIGEAASGYPPGGSAFTSVLNFASGVLALVGVALSFWRAWVGGVFLIIVWVEEGLSLLLGLEPQANVPMGLVVGIIVTLLPGLLFVAASMIRHQSMRAEVAGTPIQ